MYDPQKVVSTWLPCFGDLNEFEAEKVKPLFEAAADGKTAADFFGGVLSSPAFIAAELVRQAAQEGRAMPAPFDFANLQPKQKAELEAQNFGRSAAFEHLKAALFRRFGVDSPLFEAEPELKSLKAALAAQWAAAAIEIERRRLQLWAEKGESRSSQLLGGVGGDLERVFLAVVFYCLNRAALCRRIGIESPAAQGVALLFRRLYNLGGITPPLNGD